MKKPNVFLGYAELKTIRSEKWEQAQSDEYKEYRKNWKEYPEQMFIPDFPLHMNLQTSNLCNLKCEFCNRQVFDYKFKNAYMPFETFKSIIDEGAKEGLKSIAISCFDEPLMNKQLHEYVAYAKSKGILDIFINTNGTLLTPDRSKQLIEAGITKIIISLDSPYKEQYEAIRKGASFDKVISNIKALFELRGENVNPLIRINMIMMPEDTMQKIDDTWLLLSNHVDLIATLRLVDLEAETPDYNNRISNFVCPQMLSRMVLDEQGNVYPCCMIAGDDLYLGNVNEGSLKDMWQSDKYNYIRGVHMAGYFYHLPSCAKCGIAIQEDSLL